METNYTFKAPENVEYKEAEKDSGPDSYLKLEINKQANIPSTSPNDTIKK